MEALKKLLENEVKKRNTYCEISRDKPDPLFIARKYQDEWISLLCALYSYGNARSIVSFLETVDFSLLESGEKEITKAFQNSYYRFQNKDDVINSFLTIKRAKEHYGSAQNLFLQGYGKSRNVIEGIYALIENLRKVNTYSSKGYDFLFAKIPKRLTTKGVSPLKRWNMYLRWMVREDCLDMGLWERVRKRDLVIPLDTHTFAVSKKLGLLQRSVYDLHAALLLTEKLKEFDPHDPIKYDFALYRLGQEAII